jgi:hypothetical protein
LYNQQHSYFGVNHHDMHDTIFLKCLLEETKKNCDVMF